MKRSSKIVLGIVIVVVLVALVAGAVGFAYWMSEGRVADGTILEVDVDEALVEYVPTDPIATLLMGKELRVRDFVEALQAAAEDDHVVALVVRVAPGGMGLAQVEELRDAVLAFRAAGKPAVAYADTFGEVSPANGTYYLASAFDEVYMQPSGDLGLTGLAFTTPFLRGTLDKIGVQPQMAQRYEYKNAMNTFTETSYTEAHRESMQTLADSMFAGMVAGIAESRKLPPDQVRSRIDHGPFLGQQAVDAGFVDGLLYHDQVYDRVRELAFGAKTVGKGDGKTAGKADGTAAAGDERGHLLYLQKYWDRADHPYAEGDHTIALIYAIGSVVRGEGGYDPLGGSVSMGGEAVSAAIRAAVDDDDVEAIVLRIDSPGGSYVASDQIWREVARAREQGKPVVASMGDVAASGGYFVAMAADKIVAHPGTITGSIGVLGGKLITREMWNKLGITFDGVKTAEHADMYSSLQPFDEEEWARYNQWLDRVYEDFTGKVAEGRHMPLARVQQIAKGRVWAGSDAKRLGLVDELGGMPTAIRLAKEAAGIEAEAKVRLREFPGEKSPFEEIFGEGPDNSEQEMTRAAVAEVLAAVRPLVRVGREMGVLGGEAGVLRMPPLGVPRYGEGPLLELTAGYGASDYPSR